MDTEIKIILDYVEGKSSINSFQYEFLHNSKLQNLLKKKFDLSRIAYKKYDFNLYTYFSKEHELANRGWDNIISRFIIWLELSRWLKFHNYSFIIYKKYQDDYDFLLDILPAWLDNNEDQGIFDRIIAQIPTDISRARRVAIGKQMVKDSFKYDKTYPRWIQGSEWPIVDGKPLVFSHQSKESADVEMIKYYFYNPATMEEYIVEQLY